MADTWDAIVLAGGKGERLGGVSKPELVVGGRAQLDRTLDALAGAQSVVIVGGPRREGVLWTVEDPAGGGPAAAVAAGMRALDVEPARAPWTVVLAVDTPGAADAVPRLLAAIWAEGAASRDGAHIVDAGGRAQTLIAVYRTAALDDAARRAMESGDPGEGATGTLAGASMRTLVRELDLAPVADRGDSSHDLDTWEDVEYWRERLG